MYFSHERRALTWGDRGDLNPRPSGPQPDALTKLSYGHHGTYDLSGGDGQARQPVGRRVAWTASARSALTVQPAIAGPTGGQGVVFVGSEDGTVLAFPTACATATCPALRSADAGNRIVGAPALAPTASSSWAPPRATSSLTACRRGPPRPALAVVGTYGPHQ